MLAPELVLNVYAIDIDTLDNDDNIVTIPEAVGLALTLLLLQTVTLLVWWLRFGISKTNLKQLGSCQTETENLRRSRPR